MKALIKVGYGCNNHCTFCHTLDRRDEDGAAEEVEARIDRAAQLGHTMVVLSGGEVTMRPELVRWAARVAARGMDFGLVTNGRMLAYPALVEKLLRCRLRYVYMSLHGGTARVHDLMVRAEAFEQTMAALRNLSGRGLELTVNTVVTRQNLLHLRGVVDAVLPYPDAVLKFSMVQPKGGADRAFEHVIPRVSLVAERVRDAIEYGLARAGAEGPRFAHDGIPLCLLPGHEARYDDLKTHRFATMVEIGEADFFPVDDRDKVHTERCAGCALKGPCPGLYRGYEALHGDEELLPVTDRTRSNSFHYVFERWMAPAGERCPVLAAGVTPWDRGRVIFVRDGARVGRFRSGSRDFSDEEIARVKHGLGQVYLDVSGKDAPDDFSRDLVQLRRSAQCGPCPERERCAGLYEAAPGDPFAGDEAPVRALLGSLEGAVLDVGCGPGRYEELLEPRARAGAIRYVGMDPDAAGVAALRARWPWAELRVGAAEAVDEVASFDHVLLLRSWNHLREPARAVDALLRALRAGGTFTVVDNMAFGLVRGRRQAARAEAGAGVFEHYRNDGAAEADAVIARAGLERLERREVAPETGNQWLLRYRKAWS